MPPPTGYPLIMPYRDGVPIPRGYHVEHRPQTGLLVTGGVALGVGYVTGLGLALHHDFDNGTSWMLLPILGPWGAIGARSFDCKVNAESVDSFDEVDETAAQANRCIGRAQSEATAIALLAVDGIIQATGTIVLLAGMMSGSDELVWDGLPGGVKLSARARPEGGGEIGVFGRF